MFQRNAGWDVNRVGNSLHHIHRHRRVARFDLAQMVFADPNLMREFFLRRPALAALPQFLDVLPVGPVALHVPISCSIHIARFRSLLRRLARQTGIVPARCRNPNGTAKSAHVLRVPLRI